jgi:PKD repeat protein
MMARPAGWPGQELVADFTADPRTGDLPLAVRFMDASVGGPTSWNWDFGDGTGGSGPNPIHGYTAAGVYTVCLTATNAGGGHTKTKVGLIEVYTCANDPVRIERTGLDYTSLQTAYDFSESADRILVQALPFSESVSFDRDIVVTLSCGYGCWYDAEPEGETRIYGQWTVSNGPVILEDGCLCVGGAATI